MFVDAGRSPWRLRVMPIVATLVVATGCGASNTATTSGKSVAPPSPAAVGTATGAPASKTIGAEGGSLSSTDGRITVTIPAGALANDTQIAIQPISNTASGGLGAAYRLSPAG